MFLHGFLAEAPGMATIGLFIVICVLGFLGVPLWGWTLAFFAALWGLGAPVWLLIPLAVLALIFNVPMIRQYVVTIWVVKFMKAMNFLPEISDTERTAIEAGTVWMDGELFSGKPDFARINAQNYPDLTADEKAFLDGPVNRLCEMLTEWEVSQLRDLPPPVWEFIKKEKFWGMIIPKEYGGLGFSALANSAVVQKLATRSLTLSVTVMVPNSLGPAELLIHYGTKAQRDHYLPRLADGREIPCFALTEPNAGSDAGAISANGEVFRGDDGKLYLRLNWNKRYITLAPIATVLGLAFKLRDPQNLLGKGDNPGITCALIPADIPGVKVGDRHDPLNVPFHNGPTTGENVVVPVDAIIGGVDGVGQGWRMLMECLAAGRGISLPAQATAGAKYAARIASGHAVVRQQFGLSIGKFEGIEEPLARIAGYAYMLEAARRFTCGAIDQGAKPAVVTAMAKYTFTEIQRSAINDCMDILGGNAISRGPRNLIADGYFGLPIGITVEGANILTRTLMIFGQGAIRCHPYAFKEIEALGKGDLGGFDRAFWGHVGHIVRNGFRTVFLSLSRGRLAASPVKGPAARYWRKLAWSSASFAFLADLAMGTLGGTLKRRERLAGRFADVFRWMYVGTAVLRRFEAEGERREDLPYLHWSMYTVFSEIQRSFVDLLYNMNLPMIGWIFRGPVAMWARLNQLSQRPSDTYIHEIAASVQTPGANRDRLTDGVYIPTDPNEALGRLERAMRLSAESEGVQRKIRDARRDGKLPKGKPAELVKAAVEAGVITADEAALLQTAETARNDYVQVDAFPMADYFDPKKLAAHRMPPVVTAPTPVPAPAAPAEPAPAAAEPAPAAPAEPAPAAPAPEPATAAEPAAVVAETSVAANGGESAQPAASDSAAAVADSATSEGGEKNGGAETSTATGASDSATTGAAGAADSAPNNAQPA